MKKLTSEDKQEIIRLRVEDNVPAKTVAEKFGITKGAVFNIVSAWKNHGESAISNDEKEPDTVAAVTDSEQEDCVEVPADIVPQEAENVKPIIPYGVREACRVRLDYLKDLIAEEQAVIDNWNAEMKEIIEFLEENKEDVDNGQAYLLGRENRQC